MVGLLLACAHARAQQEGAGAITAKPVRAISPDQDVGKSFHVDAGKLPAPNATRSVSNGPLTIPFQAQAPLVPQDFTATLFAKLEHPRRLLVLPNGDIIVAEQTPGRLTLLRPGADNKAELIERHAEGFNQPYGLAWRDGAILVADQDGIWTVPHTLGNVRAGHGEDRKAADTPSTERKPTPAFNSQKLLTRKGVFGIVRGHVNRPLAIDPKTGALFVGVGSSGNIGIEPEVKATIQRFDADGGNQSTFVAGVRNTCGLAVHPETGELWAVVQERDGLGDDLVPDFLIRAESGAFYGWPYAYVGRNPQPGFASKSPGKVGASRVPDLLFQAHSAALDIAFYTGAQFPSDYRGDAFVALKGSWNRSQPTGYKVVRVRFRDGRPQGGYENFMTGFWVAGHARAEVWGRPAALAVMHDGALLVADDTSGTLWRVSYTGRKDQGASPTR